MSLELSRAKDFVSWMSRKVELNHQSTNARTRQIKRGEVYWCEFGLNVGSEMSKTTPRPAVIIQNNRGNNSSSNTIVVPLTHNSKEGVFIVPIETQFRENGEVVIDGNANTSNIICVSKARLRNYITKLSKRDMRAIDESLIAVMGLKPRFDKLKKQYDSIAEKLEQLKSACKNK